MCIYTYVYIYAVAREILFIFRCAISRREATTTTTTTTTLCVDSAHARALDWLWTVPNGEWSGPIKNVVVRRITTQFRLLGSCVYKTHRATQKKRHIRNVPAKYIAHARTKPVASRSELLHHFYNQHQVAGRFWLRIRYWRVTVLAYDWQIFGCADAHIIR